MKRVRKGKGNVGGNGDLKEAMGWILASCYAKVVSRGKAAVFGICGSSMRYTWYGTPGAAEPGIPTRNRNRTGELKKNCKVS